MSAVMKARRESAGLSRREFLARVGALGGLVLIAGVADVAKAEDARKYGADSMPHGWSDNPRTPTVRAAHGTSSSRCAAVALLREPCWSRRRRPGGAYRSARCRL